MHIVHIIVLADYESVSEEIRLKVFNDTLKPGGVRTTIAKHHGRYSKSDHLCQDGVE